MIALLVDIGNSRIKWRFTGTGDDGVLAVDDLRMLAERWASSTARAVEAVFVSNVADAGVAAIVSDFARAIWPDVDVHRVGPMPAQCGVVNGYRDPAQLGPDRWLAMLGAHAAFPGRHLLVASFGTATTIDLLLHDDEPSRQATFVGGMILPGHDAMRNALASTTARLPLALGTPADLGATTDDAIASGVVAAQVGAVERAMKHAGHRTVSRSQRRMTCVIAGGGAATIRPFLDATLDVELVPDLVLRGLSEVADDTFARALITSEASPCARSC